MKNLIELIMIIFQLFFFPMREIYDITFASL